MTKEEKTKANDGNYKAYTELISRLEDVKDAIKKQNYGIAMDILYQPYPKFQITTSTENEESEDDGIRKALLEIVHDTTGDSLWVDYNVHKEDALAWLEKQGEQKLAWSEEDEVALGDALWCCKQAASIAKDENDMGNIWYTERWLKSLKDRVQPQSQWKPSEEQIKALNYVVNIMASSERPTENDLYYNILKSLREQLRKLTE